MNKKHSQFFNFTNPSLDRIASNGLLHRTANGCPLKFKANGTTGSSSMFVNDLGTYVLEKNISTRQDTPILEFWGIWEHPSFYLSVCWYCVSCLSIIVWWPGDHIHYFCCGHLRCRWVLFSENCKRSRVVFYNVTWGTTRPLYFWNFGSNSAFLRCHMSINVEKWSSPFVCCASLMTFHHLLFCSWPFFQLPRWNCFELVSFLFHCCLRIRDLHNLRHRNICVPNPKPPVSTNC